jgi:hypothetical protein
MLGRKITSPSASIRFWLLSQQARAFEVRFFRRPAADGHRLEHGRRRRHRIHAGLHHLAEQIKHLARVLEDFDVHLRLAEHAPQMLNDIRLQLRDGHARGLDVADQRHEKHAVGTDAGLLTQVGTVPDRDAQLVFRAQPVNFAPLSHRVDHAVDALAQSPVVGGTGRLSPPRVVAVIRRCGAGAVRGRRVTTEHRQQREHEPNTGESQSDQISSASHHARFSIKAVICDFATCLPH